MTATFTVAERYMLERLRDLIKDNTVNEGIPRTKITTNDDGTFTATLQGMPPQKGVTVEDALSAMHDYMLIYYKRLSNPKHVNNQLSLDQLRMMESFLQLRVCDCKCSTSTYCYCRGFETS